MFKKIVFTALAFVALASAATAQSKYFTKTGHVSFYSDGPMEKILAHNYKATSVVDASTGAMEFAMLMKAFEFEKALMQEHFNENYVESGKFPKATFKGKVENIGSINFAKDGTYNVKVKGDMTIHGVTKAVETDGKFIVKGGVISAKSEFNIKLADYGIQIPGAVTGKIAETVKITVNVDKYELMTK